MLTTHVLQEMHSGFKILLLSQSQFLKESQEGTLVIAYSTQLELC